MSFKLKNKFNIPDKKTAGHILLLLAGFLCVTGLFFGMKDAGAVPALRWLLVTFLMSLLLRPYLPILHLPMWDDGFTVSFGASLGLSFFITYIICRISGIPFADPVCFITFILLAAIAVILSAKGKLYYRFTGDGLVKYLRGFLLFCIIFLVYFYIIGFKPEIDSGTENYMDYGFMQVIFRQKSILPEDMWMSGYKLNYYYLGQAAAVYMTRLSVTTPEYGYNLMLCSFIATVCLSTSEIAYGFVKSICKNHKQPAAVCAGIISGALSALSANGQWVIYGIIVPLFDKLKGRAGAHKEFWFSDPTVYISTALGDADNGKNEFPAYSVLLGDLHAHVVDVIFTLSFMAVMFDYILDEDDNRRRNIYRFVFLGLLLSLFKGANYWDFAIFYVICGAMVVFKEISRGGFSGQSLIKILKAALIVTIVSFAAAIPFNSSFEKISSSINLSSCHTSLIKLLVLWGFPFGAALVLTFMLIGKKGGDVIANKSARMGFCAFLMCTMGLIITPELIYVEDIYGSDSARFNTMFKLTYVAFILFCIIIGIIGALFWEHKRRALFGVVCFLGLLLCAYTPKAVKCWQGDVLKINNRKGISALQSLYSDESYGFEMKIYDVLMADVRENINIVEMAGESYNHGSAISVYTGCSAVAGWFTHEWLWRDNAALISLRQDEVMNFYQSGDEEYCRDFLEKYDIDYIVKGPAEVCKYYVLDEGFERFGEVILEEEWQGVMLKLIKVDKGYY